MRLALTLSLIAGPLLAQAVSPVHIAHAHRRDSTSASNRFQKRINSGYATWFDTGMGACGWWNNPGDFIVAMNSNQFDNSICGKQLWVSGPAGTQTATVADECPEDWENCHPGDMDMSTGLFQAVIGDLGLGKMPITWDWIDSSGGGNNGGGGGNNGGGGGDNGGGDRGGSSDVPATSTRYRCHKPTGL